MNKKLKRSLSLFSLTFYGMGSIIGAGIYVIVGQVASQSGMLTPIAFLLSAIVAFFSAMSFAELSSRYPQSAGEAVYIKKAFSNNFLTQLIGWLVVLTGIISTAALANGFVGYLDLFVIIPAPIVKIFFIVTLSVIAFWGIKESVFIIVLITLIEIAGLILVISLAIPQLPTDRSVYLQLVSFDQKSWQNIIFGAFIAFYAFIGFEDIVNVAEEVKNPRKTLVWGLLLSVVISSAFYLILSFFAVATLPLHILANSSAPMAKIVENAGYSTVIIGVIGLITVVNGGLVNIIMASRVIYGMSKLKVLPALLGNVHTKTQTPHMATMLVAFIILLLALIFPILTLARMTSFVMLIVYFFVNLSLVVIKLKKRPIIKGAVNFPIIFPFTGVLITLLFLILQLSLIPYH